MMPALVFDIETSGKDFDSFDEETQAYLTKSIQDLEEGEDKQAKLESIINGFSLTPLTGEIVSLGMLDCEKNIQCVYFQAPGKKIKDFEEDNIIYRAMTEKQILEKFWELAERYDEFITFNGRCFDVPFLMIRSAAHKIKTTRKLMDGRWLYQQNKGYKHYDLMDLLSFHNSYQPKFGSLMMYCKAFGIDSPKQDGITGADVPRLFKEKKYLEIARYNARDLTATRELFNFWKDYINS